MASGGSLLDLAADLERRDQEVASALDRVDQLDRQAEAIRARSEELRRRLEAAPASLAALDRSHADARDAAAAAATSRRDAEVRVAALRQSDTERRDRAQRQLERAREVEADASTRVDRLDSERLTAAAAIAAARAREAALLHEAADVSAALAQVERLSASGREPPAGGARRIEEWSSRVHAALFVVRGQLQTERERLVREANELGGAVLGEQLAGSSVSLVRRRLEEALRS
jgi:chromosome segregation ATPase